MLRLLNRDRKDNGLPALFMQDDLRTVARKHSRDMAKKDYFEHEDQLGRGHTHRYKVAGITEVISGENLAKIGGFPHPVERAENGLMNSPGHRRNILNSSFNCVGIGVHKSETKVYYFTQNFAYRALIITNKIPTRVSLNKGLLLKFYPAKKVRMGLYRVSMGAQLIKEKPFPIKQEKNFLNINFPERGLYRVEIFTSESNNSYHLCNIIDLSVRTGMFW